MLITSETGEASEYPFTASSADGWTFDFPEYTPLVTIAQPSLMLMVTTDVDLWGYTDPRAELVLETRYHAPDATRQFAFIRGIDITGTRPALIVDYAEFLGGEEAVQAAIEDGELPADQADEWLPNDFYIRNQNPQLRTLPFEPNAPIYLFDQTIGEELDFDSVTLDELAHIVESGEDGAYYGGVTNSTVWLIVQDDVILQLQSQYLP